MAEDHLLKNKKINPLSYVSLERSHKKLTTWAEGISIEQTVQLGHRLQTGNPALFSAGVPIRCPRSASKFDMLDARLSFRLGESILRGRPPLAYAPGLALRARPRYGATSSFTIEPSRPSGPFLGSSR